MAKKTQAQIEFKAVTSEFNKGIVSMNKDIKGLNGALRLNAEELKGNAQSVEALKDRQKLLEEKYTAVTKKVELTEKSLQACKLKLGENSNEYRNLSNELNKAKTVQQQVQNEINQTANKLDAMTRAEREAKTPLAQLNSEINAQEKELTDLKAKYTNVYLEQGQASKEAQELKNKISALSKELNGNKAKLKQAGDAAEKAGEKAENSADGYTVIKNVVANLATEALDKAAESFKELAAEGEAALDKLQAKVGASNTDMKGYSDIAQNIYKNGWGESLDDVTEALGTVINMTDDLDKKTLQNVTENAMTLSDVYDMDTTESMRAVNSLMKQFGISADEAYNLVVQGAQNGLNQNDDLLDTINEYSVQFSSAGYSANDMFNMLKNGADTGTWSIDKLGDAVKEYNIRMTDGTANEALEALGLNAEKVTAEYAKGGESAQKATQQVIQALMDCDDPQKQYIYGQQIMGTMWEDLGVDAVKSLMNTNGEISKTNDAMGDVKTDAYDNLKTSVTTLGRTVKTDLVQPLVNNLAPALTTSVNKLTEAAKWLKEHKGVIIAVGSAIGVVAAAIGLYNIVQGIKTAMDAAQVTTVWALVAAHLAQAAAAMAALAPYILIVAAIAAVIAIIVVCIKHWDKIKAKVIEVATAIKEKVIAIKNSIVEKFTEAKNKAVSIFNSLKSGIIQKITSIKSKVTTVFNSVKESMMKPINSAKDKIKSAIDKIKSFFNVSLKFKSIKMPHFSVTYDTSGAKGKIGKALGLDGFPKLSVKWYAKGGYFPKPTIIADKGIGVGDSKGGEYALPLNNSTLSPLAAMINKNMAAQGYNKGTDELLKGIYKETRESNRLFKERMIDALVNGVDLVIDNRELARLIKKYG